MKISNMEDDGISIMYRQEVLGKKVWIKFPMNFMGASGRKRKTFKFFQGTITKMEVYFPDHDTTKPLEYQHFVFFGGQDDGYYNLTEQEDSGYLKWNQDEIEIEDECCDNDVESVSSADDGLLVTTKRTTSELDTTVAATVVTPTKPSRKRQASNNAVTKAPRNNVRVKLEFGSVRSNIEDPSNAEINGNEFYHWLTQIHKGQRGNPISQANARSVRNRVCDLISGNGISYKRWPDNVKFHSGLSVDLNTDFTELMEKAKFYENKYGKDLGNGWLLRHPIKKMDLFKEYVERKRHERANPELIE